MAQKSTPDFESTPRGRLARHLRLARQAAGLKTQQPLATLLSVSVDLISKIEKGKHVPPRDIFTAWLDACKVPEEARVYLTDIWEMARASMGVIPEFIQKFIAAEARCEFLWVWAPVLIPGQFQVEEYAMETFRLFGKNEDEATDETSARMERQAIQDGPDPAQVVAVIHESVLYRRVGAPEVMARQLTRLLEASEKPSVIIQVVRDDAYFPGLEAHFEVAIGDDITDTMVTVAVEDYVDERREIVRTAIALFQQIRARALPAEESRAVIREALQKWESQQRTPAGASPATAATAEPPASRPGTCPVRSSSATPPSTGEAQCSA